MKRILVFPAPKVLEIPKSVCWKHATGVLSTNRFL